MSRSYYKYPSVKDYSRNYTSWSKRQASKAARRNWKIGDGANYKKVYCRYNIFDYRSTYYYDYEVFNGWYANKVHRLCKKSLVKRFGRDSIRYIMDVDSN